MYKLIRYWIDSKEETVLKSDCKTIRECKDLTAADKLRNESVQEKIRHRWEEFMDQSEVDDLLKRRDV